MSMPLIAGPLYEAMACTRDIIGEYDSADEASYNTT